jgi:pimeloyl-ACP methyl ester carboxylesterase
VEFLRRTRDAYGARLRDRFDLVSWDPRGVGGSAPVRCGPDPSAVARFLATDPDPDSAAEERQVVAEVTAFADQCRRTAGTALLGNVDTESSARDLERLRAALGGPLTYLGFSYGTLLGAVYADLYPTRIRAMVLDAALDPTVSTFQRLRVQAAGFEEALGLWAAWCDDDRACRRAVGDDPKATALTVVDRLDRAPVAVGDRMLTQSDGLYAVLGALYSPRSGWPRLGDALGDALSGRGGGLLALADAYNDRQADGSYRNTVEANLAINCADESTSPDPGAYARLADELAGVSVLFGRAIAWSALPCGRWPVPARGIAGPRRAPGSPPIVVVGTLRDPATPMAWARALAAQLDNGVLVENDASGHAAYFSGGTCVRTAIEDHLLGVRTPVDGLRCRGSQGITPGTNPGPTTPS